MKKNPEEIILKLKKSGHRITKVRSLIVELFINSSIPINLTDIQLALENLEVKTNRTTIYRELDFLLREGIIKELQFGEAKKRYEIDAGENHHHHLICTNCKKVEDIDLDTDLHKEEEKIFKEKGFKTTSHSLEFFGLCKDCQKLLS